MEIQNQIFKTIKYLIFKEPFYGMFLSGINKDISKEKSLTAGVCKNGINAELTINPDYWEKIGQEYWESLLIHEVLHIAYMHLDMRVGLSDKLIFNLAADCTVNQHIKKLHPNWITINSFPELDLIVEEGTLSYYNKLLAAKGNCPSLDRILEQYGDIHPTWKEFDEMSDTDKHLFTKQVEFQLKELYQNLKSVGTLPGNLEEFIKGLFKIVAPVFNWKQYLRRFIQGSNKYYTKRTRSRLNKRFSYLPGMKIDSYPRILIGVDTSGSVSMDELEDFFSEIHHIWKTGVDVDIVECDAVLYTPYSYNGKFIGKIHGRGGTSFQPVIDYYNKNKHKYNTLIYFTDGECSPPSKPKGTMLWVISSNITDNGREWYKDLPGYKFIIPKNNND